MLDSAGTVYFDGYEEDNPHKFFSLYYLSPFQHGDVTYLYAGQWIAAEKARRMGDQESLARIITCTSPSEIKSLERCIQPWQQSIWDDVDKFSLMLKAIRLKASQNNDFLKHLLSTGSKTIARASEDDTVWGVGLSIFDAKAGRSWKGKNLLGNVLMTVRDEFRSQYDVARDVVSSLKSRNLTVSVAESCTGGGLGSAITAVPGSSVVFVGGVIAYTNRVKQAMLKIEPELLRRHGAVSEKVAAAMANSVRESFASDIGIAVTGYAGPGQGVEHDDIGLVYVAVAFQGGMKVVVDRRGDVGRWQVRSLSVDRALRLVLSHLKRYH